LPGDVVVRSRLLSLLNRQAALTLVVAPAGYGKTTLVGTWITQLPMPAAWLSLDKEENDPLAFLAAMIAAVQTVFSGFGADILAALNAPHSSAFGDLMVSLCNELNLLTREFTLVLEDYHVVHTNLIHELLLYLVTYPPQAMHLVITARHDPPLPWRTRVRGDFCELRAADLNFTAEEARQFLANATDWPVGGEDVHALVEQAQGWITSLRLAALTIRRQGTETDQARLLNADFRNFSDYFNEEVLAELEPQVLAFLLRTSILELLSGPLCDFVDNTSSEESDDIAAGPPVRQGRGATLLRELEHAGVFTVALDDQGIWYRYHPLLRGVLRRRLEQTASPDEVAELYLRAAGWHEERNFLDEALTYTLSSGQIQHAVAFIQRRRHQLLDNFDWRRLERWLHQFPSAVISQHIELTLARMWINYWHYNMPDNDVELVRVEGMLSELPPDAPDVVAWRGEIATLRSHRCTQAGDAAGALAAANTALADVPPHRFYVSSTAMVQWAFACQMGGQWQQAQAGIQELENHTYTARDLARARTLQLLVYINLPAAKLNNIRLQMPQLLSLVTAREFKTSMAWAHYAWGCACYLQNQLGAAEEHFRAVVELADHAHAMSYTHSVIGLALVCQAQGRELEATSIVEDARRLLSARQQSYVLTVVNAFATELAARQGRREDALRWVTRESRQYVLDALPIALYYPMLGYARVLLAGGTVENLRDARTWLQRQTEVAVRTFNLLAQIQARVLEAAVCDAQGDREGAITALAYALTTAEQDNVLRPFVELAAQLAPLLEELDPSRLAEPPAEFMTSVRTAVAFEQERLVQSRTAQWTPPTTGDSLAADNPAASLFAAGYNGGQEPAGHNPAGSGSSKLAPPDPRPQAATGPEHDLSTLLTYREMDVLRLLEQRLTNKEIAHKLGITTETVRQHTVNLFRKLGVQNRRQAVVAAYRQHFFYTHP
jgi:LuxR family maltose regulon positive regulatory protein